MTQNSNHLEWVSAIANVFAAIGTVGAVIVALFQDQIRNLIFPASATIELDDPEGEFTLLGGFERIRMFHLRIRNTSRNRVLHRCVVLLDEVSRPSKVDGPWEARKLPVPLPLHWAPSETQPLEIDVRPGEEAIADLLWFRQAVAKTIAELNSPRPMVQPTLVTEPANFAGILREPGHLRYHLVVRADELAQPVRVTFQVDWTEPWPALTVRRISAPLTRT